ncbi:uncharacterized protein LOC123268076 [Cotesia glomerata]|uniref:uncharacterized protein LOC123268076 n=1 Tax=Cotesia glomerata TaxID=32391 RepID=UPI001D0164A5|nr:uncharacterized protein LOC123268076 [Cotesia glomerata]
MIYPKKLIFITIFLVSFLVNFSTSEDDVQHDHVIIYVPYYIKTLKHTHTITKYIHQKEDDKKYKVLGYTVGKPILAPHQVFQAESYNQNNNNEDCYKNYGHGDNNNKEEMVKTYMGYLGGVNHYAGHNQINHNDFPDKFSRY